MINMVESSTSRWVKNFRSFISLMVALGMVFIAMPFAIPVYADSNGTYTEYSNASGIFEIYNASGYSHLQTEVVGSGSARTVTFKTPSNVYYVFFISIDNVRIVQPQSAESYNSSTYLTQRTYTTNGITYYSNSVSYGTVSNPVYSPIVIPDSWPSTTAARAQLAYDYTFGDYAVDPVPDITYGQLKDLGYTTSIVGSGAGTGEANEDTISWYTFADVNHNPYEVGDKVDIRVVPGQYVADSETNLLNKLYTDFALDYASAGTLGQADAKSGKYTVTWGRVMNVMNYTWGDLYTLFDKTQWIRKGWVYQARIHRKDDSYIGEWQTVYTITSSTPDNGLDPGGTIGDFYENVVDSFNTTSTINNNSNVIYFINNQPVLVNPDVPDDPNEYIKDIRDYTWQIRNILTQIEINTSGQEKEPDDHDLNITVNNLHNTENQYINDMDDQLNDIDPSDVSLLSTNKFINAANWVRVQYNHLVMGTPFEMIIFFSLILGLGLLIIGKLK